MVKCYIKEHEDIWDVIAEDTEENLKVTVALKTSKIEAVKLAFALVASKEVNLFIGFKKDEIL